jgi:biopolymer transport protein ExbD/predicted Zn-dependent protease
MWRDAITGSMKIAAGVVLAFICGCMSPVMRFGGKSEKEVQHDDLAKQRPSALAKGKWTGEVRTAKIRVWADDDYRSQNIQWQQSFESSLDEVNQVLSSTLGVRLVAEYKSWDRHATASTLTDDLEALGKMDPGDDVLTVVGLTSSLTLVSATFEQLGYASLPGRHLVVRGYADLEERKAYESAFRDLRGDEREAVLDARRLHKTTAVLLHELGHNLGAPHETDPDTIMNPMYSNQSSSFSDHTREILLSTLDQRLNRNHEPPTTIAKTTPHDGASTTITEPPQAPRAFLVLRITLKGETIVDGKSLDDAALGDMFQASFAQDHNMKVLVEMDRKVPYSAVVKVLDRAKAAGLVRFAVGTSGH